MDLLSFANYAADSYKKKGTFLSEFVIFENHKHRKNHGRQVRVWEHDQCYVVAFAGTDVKDPRDLITDADAFLYRPEIQRETGPFIRELADAGAAIHRGFWRVSEMIPTLLEVLVKSDKPIIFASHSLGWGFAQVAAACLMDAGRKVAAAIGFGPPRVGNRIFSQMLRKRTVVLTVSVGRDPIIHLPPAKLGFEAEGHFHIDEHARRVFRKDPDFFQWRGFMLWLWLPRAVRHFRKSHAMRAVIASIVAMEGTEIFHEQWQAYVSHAIAETDVENKNRTAHAWRFITCK